MEYRYHMKILRPSSFYKKSSIHEDVRKLFSGFGSVLLIRNGITSRCICSNPYTGSYNTKCRYCVGTGWIPVIERHQAYSYTTSVPETLPRLIRTISTSNITIDSRVFFFRPHVRPAEGDYIVQTTFNSNGEVVMGDMKFFKVNFSDAKTDEHGDVVIYKASCEKNPIDSDIRAFHLYRTRDSIIYLPIHER